MRPDIFRERLNQLVPFFVIEKKTFLGGNVDSDFLPIMRRWSGSFAFSLGCFLIGNATSSPEKIRKLLV
jgi:hypothetical protein